MEQLIGSVQLCDEPRWNEIVLLMKKESGVTMDDNLLLPTGIFKSILALYERKEIGPAEFVFTMNRVAKSVHDLVIAKAIKDVMIKKGIKVADMTHGDGCNCGDMEDSDTDDTASVTMEEDGHIKFESEDGTTVRIKLEKPKEEVHIKMEPAHDDYVDDIQFNGKGIEDAVKLAHLHI